jgi:predicted RNase H-like HicB family nuclease
MNAAMYNAVITEEDGGFVALNPEYDVASQGDTIEAALANLREALELYLEEAQDNTPASSAQQQRRSFLTTFSL